MKAIRIELLIATLALLASAAASIATVVQTGTIGNQLSASVWPYLKIQSTIGQDDIKVGIVNEGLGPAIVQSATLAMDGKPLANWRAAIAEIIARDHKGKAHLGIEVSSVRSFFGTGDVIRAGDTSELISLHTQIARDFASYDDAPHLDLSVCYCSILQQCWIVEETSQTQPRPVHDCGNNPATLRF